VTINHLFADSVVDGRCRGEVRADDCARPSIGYVVHPYGMSLLFGREGASLDEGALDAALARPRAAPEWLQVFPSAWGHDVETHPRARAAGVERHVRLNFRFDRARFDAFRAARIRSGCPIVRVDRALFETGGSVVPRYFWDDADAFLQAGGGFAALLGGAPASIAFTSFADRERLELGIETAEAHRGRGLAREACAALIEDALARGLLPVWACRDGNVASRRLAESLGFVVTARLPYFRLG
jgi:RimJ/RimL family protein N-acetyltransferase